MLPPAGCSRWAPLRVPTRTHWPCRVRTSGAPWLPQRDHGRRHASGGVAGGGCFELYYAPCPAPNTTAVALQSRAALRSCRLLHLSGRRLRDDRCLQWQRLRGQGLRRRQRATGTTCSASEDKVEKRTADASGREQGRRLGRVFISFVRAVVQAVVSVVWRKTEATAGQQAARVGSLVLFLMGILCGLDAAQAAARREVQRRVLVPATRAVGTAVGREVQVKETNQLAPWGVKLAGIRVGPG